MVCRLIRQLWHARAMLPLALPALCWGVLGSAGLVAQTKGTPGVPESIGASYDPKLVAALLIEAKTRGDARRGAEVFGSPQFACLSCHKIANRGGIIGPDLSSIGLCLSAEKIVESVLWPRREVKKGYMALAITTQAGKLVTGYLERDDGTELVLRDPATGHLLHVPKRTIEERQEVGTLMPDGLATAMSPSQRRDLIRFLLELRQADGAQGAMLLGHAHAPTTFPYDRAPLRPEQWPHWQSPVNRDRLYDYYAKEAEYFRKQPRAPALLPEFPGLDGGKYGHWGNQNELTWMDDRWNKADLGSVLCGVFHGAGITVPRGVCVRLGDHGERAVCFNPDTLCCEVLWRGGFVKFSAVRHGFLDGLLLDGTPLPRPEGHKPNQPFVYHGYYRYGKRVLFSYRLGDVEMLDAPWVDGDRFTRLVAPAQTHPLAGWTHGGPAQWPQVLTTRGTLGHGGPYVVDHIGVPFNNPWKAPLFFGDHDFLPDGTALLCTMQGDVWRVQGLDDQLDAVRWRRIASGLHQALGLVALGDEVFVLGRNQITRLHDLNGDGEADFYECFSNAYTTSAAGHDFICGLQRDTAGSFYAASGPQGLLQISTDGKRANVVATGFRNPDGLGLLSDGSLTVPCSEGEWTPASMICLVRPGSPSPPDFGYGGPKHGCSPALPLVYLPRGLDNSSGAQVAVTGDRWGPLQGQLLHLSSGAGSHFLVLREEVEGQPQGAVVPLPGEFRSGVHRGRFNPSDGQLYVSGMGGWGTYTLDDGCFERVRYTGQPVQLPTAVHVRRNGVLVTFTRSVNPYSAAEVRQQFAQVWNYRYSSGYGSAEFSTLHPDTPGHDPLAIRSAHVLADGRTVFLEMPDLQPVNQLHLHLRVDSGPAVDLFVTVHKLGAPFMDFPGYHPADKIIAAHPLLADLARTAPAIPNPWRARLPGARTITLKAGQNLTFSRSSFVVRPGEAIRLVFANPDVVPHNWVLIKPGTLMRVGERVNHLIAEPDAIMRSYVPPTDDVLAYVDIVPPQGSFTIYFRAPLQKGGFPYLCTFPGHWMVMNGQMIVK